MESDEPGQEASPEATVTDAPEQTVADQVQERMGV